MCTYSPSFSRSRGTSGSGPGRTSVVTSLVSFTHVERTSSSRRYDSRRTHAARSVISSSSRG